MIDFHLRTTCRLCDGPLCLGLSLIPTPLANELVTKEFVDSGKRQDVFPLDVMVCEKCGHVQLLCVVSPERLFRNYPYRSGASKQFVDHLQAYADDVYERFKPKRVLEIGSNDGTMLRMFQEKGCEVLGVEPAENIAKIANDAGVPTYLDFFPTKHVLEIPSVDLVIANHVFAHADDLCGMATAVREVLKPDGVFVFEVGYLVDVIQKGLWDCIYHEHMSVHHVRPLVGLFDRLGMTLFDVQRVDTQGGALRCFVREGIGPLDVSLLMEESRLDLDTPGGIRRQLISLGDRIKTCVEMGLHALCRTGLSRIAAYGAPAKATTFLHQFGIGRETIDFVVDDSPLKQGLYLPGKQIPILPTSALYERKPDYCLILAWNFAEQIIRNNKEYKGKWIVPLPELRVI